MAGMIPSVRARYSKASTASSSVTGTYSARPDVVEVGVLRADARVVQPGGDGVDRGDLAVLVLAEVGLHAVENAQPAGGDGGGGLRGVHPPSGGLTADEADARDPQ